MDFSLEQYIEYTKAEVLKNTSVKGEFSISTDTRNITSQDIFMPIIGEKFNGHDFIEQAVKNGVRGYFTSDKTIVFDEAEFVLFVPDTVVAYLQIASAYKELINPKTIAVTGSSGKTTTKEMIASVCAQQYKTHKTKLNHNNEIGMAQTLLSMPQNTEVLVVEMGMRALGEIDLLSKYAKPDIGIITNIGTAHIGKLGSVENIAKAKCELTGHLPTDGLLVMEDNSIADDFIGFKGEIKRVNLKKITEKGKLKIISSECNLSEFDYEGNIFRLNFEGEYNIVDALYAIEIGKKLNIPFGKIAEGLKKYKSVGYRWNVERLSDLTVINDSYNANPESMKCAIKTFLECYPKPHILVLGDMGELGEKSEFLHNQIGLFLNEYEAETLYTVGKLSRNIATSSNWNTKSFDTKEELTKYIKENIKGKVNILLKASRAMQFEKIVEELKKL